MKNKNLVYSYFLSFWKI